MKPSVEPNGLQPQTDMADMVSSHIVKQRCILKHGKVELEQ